NVAYTRLEPDAAVVLIETRWHEDDLGGWLLRESIRRNAGTSSTCRRSPKKTSPGARRANLSGQHAFRFRHGSPLRQRLGQVLGLRCTNSGPQPLRVRFSGVNGGGISRSSRSLERWFSLGIARSRRERRTTIPYAPPG